MSKNELVAKIEALNEWEAVIEEAKAEAEAIRDSIKAEMMERDTEEMTAGKYIVRWTSVLSNRFDTTAFKKAHGEFSPIGSILRPLRRPTASFTRSTPSRAPAAASPSAPKEKPLVRPADQSKRTKSFPPIQTERARTL